MSEQVWGTAGLGGYSATASIDNELRQRATKSTYFYQASPTLSSYGKHRSNQILFDKMGRLVTAMNTSGIGELDAIPVTTFPWVQGTLTATEYANAVEWTEKLETYSQFSIGQAVARVLRQDQIEGLDKVAFAAYSGGKVIYVTTSATTGTFTTNGTPAGVATNKMATPHVKDITDRFRTTSVPALMDGSYLAIVHPDHARGIKDSSDFFSVKMYNDPGKTYSSEIGTYANVRFVEENNALASPAGTNTAGFAQGVYFGADNVVSGVAVAPHLRWKIPANDFGRDRGEASYFNGGFVKVWSYDTDGGEDHEVFANSQ
jgi:N4-gp56 family major capsid protein